MDKDKQNTRVTIEEAENGIVCEVCYGEGEEHQDKKYIYPDIKKAAKELPGIFSVAQAESPDENEESMGKMKNKLNSKY